MKKLKDIVIERVIKRNWDSRESGELPNISCSNFEDVSIDEALGCSLVTNDVVEIDSGLYLKKIPLACYVGDVINEDKGIEYKGIITCYNNLFFEDKSCEKCVGGFASVQIVFFNPSTNKIDMISSKEDIELIDTTDMDNFCKALLGSKDYMSDDMIEVLFKGNWDEEKSGKLGDLSFSGFAVDDRFLENLNVDVDKVFDNEGILNIPLLCYTGTVEDKLGNKKYKGSVVVYIHVFFDGDRSMDNVHGGIKSTIMLLESEDGKEKRASHSEVFMDNDALSGIYDTIESYL